MVYSKFPTCLCRSENSLKALAQTVLAVPMPEDPLTECQPSKIVALYKAGSTNLDGHLEWITHEFHG